MQLTKGKIQTGQRIVIYGPEGIGKSTLASQFPAPVFIDTEGSTKHMDVARCPKTESWSQLKQIIKDLKAGPQDCKTLVIDTADWAERMIEEHVIAAAPNEKIKGIEDFGYGKGFTFVAEEFGKLLNFLADMADVDVWNIIFTAHSQIRKFEQPDEVGAYDRYELKLGKKCSALLKEWADAVLFCNYKTMVVDVEGKKKAQGGKRVINTSHHPSWDAKNRWGLPEEVPMEYDSIRQHIHEIGKPETTEQPKAPDSEARAPGNYEAEEREAIDKPETTAPQPTGKSIPEDNPQGFPTKIWELMRADNITEEQVRKAVAKRGYYPEETPIDRYSDEFMDGVLVAGWEKVAKYIKENL